MYQSPFRDLKEILAASQRAILAEETVARYEGRPVDRAIVSRLAKKIISDRGN